jgi:hypothetical protein
MSEQVDVVARLTNASLSCSKGQRGDIHHEAAAEITALRARAEAAEADAARLRAALIWYASEAKAIAKNMLATPPKPEACMASLTVLSRDGGRRADAAMSERK